MPPTSTANQDYSRFTNSDWMNTLKESCEIQPGTNGDRLVVKDKSFFDKISNLRNYHDPKPIQIGEGSHRLLIDVSQVVEESGQQNTDQKQRTT